MRFGEGSRFEQLEGRCLLAVRSVDFDNYPLEFTQYDWMLQNSHTPSTGFSYVIGTGNGQRPNVNGITWPDAAYYDSVLGAGGFTSVDSWNMKPVVLYTQARNGGWLTQGWNYVPDMAEGAACIDDAARAAVTYSEDYLLNGTASSYQTARDILTFVAYMTTRQGKVLAYSGDTDYCPGLVALARDADVLIAECSFPDDRKVTGHLTPSLVGRAARESGCRKVVLTHLYPPCDTCDIAQAVQGEFAGTVIVAEDLMNIVI